VTVWAGAACIFLRKKPDGVQSSATSQNCQRLGLSEESSWLLFSSLWHQTTHHSGRMTEGMPFEIGQRFFAIRTSPLLLEQKDG
jgi:hypothetical protein